MHTEHRIDIDAPPERVWAVMTDIERWPEMTPSVTAVELTPKGPLTPTSEARITQPKFGSNVWRVTALDPGRSFTWETKRPGSRMVGSHTIEARTGGGSTVTLAVDSTGWAVALLGWALKGTGRRFVELEAAGLKRLAEAG